jgi:hypothetical protein
MEPGNNLNQEKYAAQSIAFLSKRTGLPKEALEELESHMWDHAEELMSAGMSPEAAFQHALGQLGETELLAAEFYKNREHPFPLGRIVCNTVFSKRAAVFFMLFLAMTFGSIFAGDTEYPSRKGKKNVSGFPAIPLAPQKAAHK